MFCPKCGAENLETAKFCRSCGVGLSGVSKVLNKKSDDSWGNSDDLWGSLDDSIDGSSRLKAPEDIYGEGVRNAIVGIGFLVVSMVLLFTGVANGQKWWWALLFPAFFSLANGISRIAKAKKIERRQPGANPSLQNQTLPNPENLNLPPTKTDYVNPHGSIYETREFLTPQSVTENTTRRLEFNEKGETATLPKKKD